ncbi:hypothetical protein PtA15_18A214 [Puccinia triticina]|uniref:DUF7143 domain-containing protein n=1 Tax=Puccinia triticina TaxID=208348 RepID=A0ABY7D660_9BASI|nr:uncharacterized protein PtA15_18A214 [Puccinia triticina]WAQ93156.1 hypothetical protein PtA15_18A214 [Puccinia triticina]WAR63135.1 hypothetical protein PtB15_18B217 [Puccinia triticina]
MILHYTTLSLSLFTIVFAIPSPAPNPTPSIQVAESDDLSIFNAKPCFILGSGKVPFKPNLEVACMDDGIRMIPPIPELSYKGIKYSAVHYRPNIVTTPVMSAFEIFTIDSQKRVPEQITFLTNARELYIAMDIAIRSLGNTLPHAGGHTRNCRAVVKVLDFQIARLEARIPAIEKALETMLKYCANCSVKERFDIIMLASQSGIIVDRFLDGLDKIGCLTKAQCDEEKKQLQSVKKPAAR